VREIAFVDDYWDLFHIPDGAASVEPHPAAILFRKALEGSFDFAADGTDDIAVYRPATGEWLIQGGCLLSEPPGDPLLVPVAADYDGDGRIEPAVFNALTAVWQVRGLHPRVFGQPGDFPVPADYNGDGRTELAVFRPSTATWLIDGRPSPLVLGSAADLPVPADYDGDGDADPAVFRRSNGEWRIEGQPLRTFGQPGDLPVPGDYNGDELAELAVFRPTAATWHVQGGVNGLLLGQPGDLPVPADYDGDSRIEAAAYHAATGTWSIDGTGSTTFGTATDVPVPGGPVWRDARFVEQNLPSTMVAGQTYGVRVTFKNTGSRPWHPIGNVCNTFRLGAANPWGNSTWGLSRAELPGVIPAGGTAAISFTVTAPSTPGTYNFQWRLLQECVEAFGDLSTNVPVTVRSAAAKDAQILWQTAPATMVAGHSYTASLRVKNVGTQTWSPVGPTCNAFRLGSANPYGNLTWGVSRSELPAPVSAGQEVTLTFPVTAPATAGVHSFQWRMVHECVEWFGDLGPNLSVTVSP
jgi:hypothetical protein